MKAGCCCRVLPGVSTGVSSVMLMMFVKDFTGPQSLICTHTLARTHTHRASSMLLSRARWLTITNTHTRTAGGTNKRQLKAGGLVPVRRLDPSERRRIQGNTNTGRRVHAVVGGDPRNEPRSDHGGPDHCAGPPGEDSQDPAAAR